MQTVDIIHRNDSKDWLIVGFFTPDYRPLAIELAASLNRQNHPHHLFAVERDGSWAHETMRKPTIVLQAMDLYPSLKLILMDVDCIVNGSLDDLETQVGTADFSCFPTLRVNRFAGNSQRFSMSSRVIFLRPTAGARRVMREWERACRERPKLHGDERNLVLALARSFGTSYSPLPEIYAGREVGSADAGAIVTHKSAAKEHRKMHSPFSHLGGLVAAAAIKMTTWHRYLREKH